MDEYFDVVDENDIVTGRASRSECHNKGLVHRGSSVFIFNSEGELLLQMRSLSKDKCPGMFTASASEHLKLGEDYESGAERAIMEEIGIETELKQIGGVVRSYSDKTDKEHSALFIGHHDGPFTPDPIEVDSVEFRTVGWVKRNISSGIFTPCFIACFKAYMELRDSGKI